MLGNGVKLPRADQDDVAGFHSSGLGINGNDTAAFFYYNDLHVIMPVKRNLCEVQWNGAQVGVVWKLDADVFFYFVKVFVGKCIHNLMPESFLLSKSCLFDSIVLLFTTMMQEIMVII